MKLEKAIEILKKEIKPKENRIAMELDIQALETVLKALEELQLKQRFKVLKSFDEATVEDLESVFNRYFIPKKKIQDILIKKQIERKPYWEQNDIMLKFIDKKNIKVTEKDLQINNKSMQLYGEIQILKELLEDKAEIEKCLK